jgi:hypothetical protein
MPKSVAAGAAYFLIVFLLGFGLGMIRVLLVAPRLGETTAVLLETPFMLAASWTSCGWCLRRFEVPPKADARAVMGVVAFALLMAAELAISVLIFGRSPTGFVAGYLTTPGAIGLAAQAAFGLMPLDRGTLVEPADQVQEELTAALGQGVDSRPCRPARASASSRLT